MHKLLKRSMATVLLACFPLVFSACGGGSGGSSNTVAKTAVSGTAIKGPIKGALVQVYTLKSDGTKGELLGSGISDGTAKYNIPIAKSKAVPPLLVVVSGQSGATYTSETTGAQIPFTSTEKFHAVLDTYAAADSFTVSPLTELAYQQVQKMLTEYPDATATTQVVSAANTWIANQYNVTSILADPATDPSYDAALTIIDQMVLTSDTGTTSQTMNLMNQALADVESQAYVNYSNQFTAAATAVVVAANDPSVTTIVNAIVATTIAPPEEPALTDTTAPNAVSGLSAVGGAETTTTSSVALTWSAATTAGSNPVAGYDVYRNGVKITSGNFLSYVDRPLLQSTTYTYYVVAFDIAGNRSAASSSVSATTPSAPNLNITVDGQLSTGISNLPQQDIAAPTAPSNLSASTTAISGTNSSVLLMWSPATDNTAVTGYEVYRNGSKIAAVSLLGYTDASVTSNTTYTYYVKAVDAAGNSSAISNQLSVTPNKASLGVTVSGQLSSDIIGQPQSDIIAPAAPATLTASSSAISGTNSSVLLAWSASSDNIAVTGYEVFRNGSKIATVTQLGYTDPSVTSSTTYTYYIKAFDAAGNRSVASTQLSVTANTTSLGVTVNGQLSTGVIGLPQSDITAPTAPASLAAATSAISSTNSSVLLTWNPSTDNIAVTGYDVYRNSSKIATVTATNYTDVSVVSGSTYTYYVQSFDAAANRSLASSLLSVTPNQASLGVTVNGQVSAPL